MQFQTYSFLTYCSLMLACNQHDYEWDDPALYHTTVSLNGKHTTQGILIYPYWKDSMIQLAMERATSDGLYWVIDFSPFTKDTQIVNLYKWSFGSTRPYASFHGSCCIPMPDITYYHYDIWEGDSLNNFLHVNVDTPQKLVSGFFKATFVNEKEPCDTVRMVCDEFLCYWE